MLIPGATRQSPPPGQSQAFPSVHPLCALTHRTQRFQLLPEPLGDPPYHYELERCLPDIGRRARSDGSLAFHVAGCTGGIKNADYQTAVAASMIRDLDAGDGVAPSFFYHLGDVVYFNGQIEVYYPQFYEPYESYRAPIVGIAGNHDGDPINASQLSLDGWTRYFMSPSPRVYPESRGSQRVTLSVPNVYFTLVCPFVTIVGLYTNVPEYGAVDSVQQQWLTHELATAPADKALLLALHHPVHSFDGYRGGSARMAAVVQQAVNESRRVPNLILSAHVHNYQRIECPLPGGGRLPFVVAGHGGHFHLHQMAAEVGCEDPSTGARLIAAHATQHGYLRLTVNRGSISGRMTTIDTVADRGRRRADEFEYPAGPIWLPDGAVVALSRSQATPPLGA